MALTFETVTREGEKGDSFILTLYIKKKYVSLAKNVGSTSWGAGTAR